jgi:hypothetical protein
MPIIAKAQEQLQKTLVIGIIVMDVKTPAIPVADALMMRRQPASEKWYNFLTQKRQSALALPAHNRQIVRAASGGTAYVPTGPAYDQGMYTTYLLLHGPFSWEHRFPGNYAVFGFVGIHSRLNTDGSVSMSLQVEEHKRYPYGEVFPPGDWQQSVLKGAWRLKSGETIRVGMMKERNNTVHIIYATIFLIKPNSNNTPTAG